MIKAQLILEAKFEIAPSSSRSAAAQGICSSPGWGNIVRILYLQFLFLIFHLPVAPNC